MSINWICVITTASKRNFNLKVQVLSCKTPVAHAIVKGSKAQLPNGAVNRDRLA